MRSAVRICRYIVVVAVLTGCSSSQPTPVALNGEDLLKEVNAVYEYLDYSKLPPPKRKEDFAPHWDTMRSAYDLVQNGDIVVAWGVSRSKAPSAAQQLLAYEKKAST